MRSAKEQLYFPYAVKTTCYIFVAGDGTVRQVPHTKAELAAAYSSVKDGSGTLYAVWPGNYRSDLFIIDDPEAFADAVGIPH